jgi:hypothetical protein
MKKAKGKWAKEVEVDGNPILDTGSENKGAREAEGEGTQEREEGAPRPRRNDCIVFRPRVKDKPCGVGLG